MEEFRDRLRAAFKHAGYVDETAARKALIDELEISRMAVSKLLSGESKGFSAENLFKAARMLGVGAEWLATGNGPMLESKLSPEVAEQAAQIDRIIHHDPDPVRREFARNMLRYAQGAPIRTQEQMVELVVELSRQLQPT